VEFAQIFNELNVFFSLIFIQKNHRNNWINKKKCFLE
jgi:hypothetical protein